MSMKITLQIVVLWQCQLTWSKKNYAGKQGVRVVVTYKTVNIAHTFQTTQTEIWIERSNTICSYELNLEIQNKNFNLQLFVISDRSHVLSILWSCLMRETGIKAILKVTELFNPLSLWKNISSVRLWKLIDSHSPSVPNLKPLNRKSILCFSSSWYICTMCFVFCCYVKSSWYQQHWWRCDMCLCAPATQHPHRCDGVFSPIDMALGYQPGAYKCEDSCAQREF